MGNTNKVEMIDFAASAAAMPADSSANSKHTARNVALASSLFAGATVGTTGLELDTHVFEAAGHEASQQLAPFLASHSAAFAVLFAAILLLLMVLFSLHKGLDSLPEPSVPSVAFTQL